MVIVTVRVQTGNFWSHVCRNSFKKSVHAKLVHLDSDILAAAMTNGQLSHVWITLKLKLNYRKKVFYFALYFLPWEFLLIQKLDFEKTKAT